MSRVRAILPASLGALAVALVLGACSDSPARPDPVPPPGGGTTPPPANTAPTIQSIVVQGSRPRQPANFADVGEVVQVTANVKDEETPLDRLQFNWSAPAGSFSGTGPSVTWRAPQTGSAAEIPLKLEVVERYGTAPNTLEHRVSSTATVALHDSIKEVGDMARQFLLDFSDSNLRDVDHIMRNFQRGCYGTAEERAQVQENRRRYQITESRVGDANSTVNFGGVCPFRARPGDACTAVPVFWQSIDFDRGGAIDRVTGTDWVASVYAPEQKRWWLCDSSFEGRQTAHSTFIR